MFEYFFEKMSTVFAQLIDNRAAKEYRDQYEVGSDDPVRVSVSVCTLCFNYLKMLLCILPRILFHCLGKNCN